MSMNEDEQYEVSLLLDRIEQLEKKLSEMGEDDIGHIYSRLIALEKLIP